MAFAYFFKINAQVGYKFLSLLYKQLKYNYFFIFFILPRISPIEVYKRIFQFFRLFIITVIEVFSLYLVKIPTSFVFYIVQRYDELRQCV